MHKALIALVPGLVLAGALASGCTVTTSSSAADGGTADGSSSADGGASGDGGGCGVGEPNDTREQATAITLGSKYEGLCMTPKGTDSDVDFYEFTAPNDAAGGYVTFSMTNVGAGSLEYKVYAAADNGEITSAYTTTNGQSVSGYFTVAPGQKYRLALDNFAGAPAEYKYDLELKYTKLNDTFEPNNTKDAAKDITVGTPVNGFFGGGYRGQELKDEDIDDWFAVDVTAGKVKVNLTDTSDVSAEVTLFSPTGEQIETKYSTTPGADINLVSPEPVAAGKYRIRVNQFSGKPKCAGNGDTLPQHLTKAYKLTVTVE